MRAWSPLLRLKHPFSLSIVGFAVTWLLGLWFGHLGWQINLLVAITAVATVVVAWRSWLLLVAMMVAGLVVGTFYGYQSLAHYQIINNLIDQKATVMGIITDDPSTNDKGTTTFSLSSLMIQNQTVPGTITVKTYSDKFQRGFKVQTTGKLYDVLGSKQAGLYGSVDILARNKTKLEKLRQRFIASMNSNLPDPLNGFSLGLIMGARSLIPKSLQDQLAVVGLSHLVAVSGYNLTIIVQMVRRLMNGTSRYVSLATTLWLVAGFVVVAGTSASIVRAAVVSVCSLVAHYYGRKIKPWVLIAVPAVLTTLWRPEYLWSDVGWQLSFLAFIGILVVAPMIESRLKRPNEVKKLIIEASCAQALTFPIILSIFHQFSVVGILANALILPMVPLAMLASFMAGAVGAVAPAFGMFSLPAYLVLKLILAVVGQLSNISWASVNFESPIPVIGMLYAAFGLAILALSLKRPSLETADGIIQEETINI